MKGKKNRFVIKKLHISIPEDLYNEVRRTGILPEIDNLVIELLDEYLEKNYRNR